MGRFPVGRGGSGGRTGLPAGRTGSSLGTASTLSPGVFPFAGHVSSVSAGMTGRSCVGTQVPEILCATREVSGRYLAVASGAGRVGLWDVRKGGGREGEGGVRGGEVTSVEVPGGVTAMGSGLACASGTFFMGTAQGEVWTWGSGSGEVARLEKGVELGGREDRSAITTVVVPSMACGGGQHVMTFSESTQATVYEVRT